MDVCVDAPLARLEIDRLSDDSDSLGVSFRIGTQDYPEEQSHSFSSDMDILCSGSLSDLVLNFDDRIYSCLDPSTNQPIEKVSTQEPTLSQIRFWWKEAVEESPALTYPLNNEPVEPEACEEIESADVDGITENGDEDVEESCSHSDLEQDAPAHSEISFQGHVTTDSECSSLASPLLTPSTPVDLMQFSGKLLRLYVDELTADVMHLSDQLVHLLASRDELAMLREASDDFIILLNLIHQRRARASRAALLLTALERMRPKRFARLKFPWFKRSLFAAPACSMTSLQEPARADHWEMMRVAVLKSGDSVALNSKNCSAAYYKSLNLQSKHRRPRTQPIVLNRHDASYHIKHATGPETVRLTGSPANENPITQPYQKSPDPVKPLSVTLNKTEDRFLTLKHLCNTLAWPNNQPQLSQSLSLQLTFSRDAAEDVTLPRLRVLNQINEGIKVYNPTGNHNISEFPSPSVTNKPADSIYQ
ncbi:uncharacterized protein DEA37_0000616 [Paragonimus westermani]|uniref:Uncharacterized protein n=1 Tax=Paragonimus westermani TaxID=34504 RepID=A0A5J4P2N3_9TREM|nr:uncharacterized protein DEA37_0000616 [Paragonimus westermani]